MAGSVTYAAPQMVGGSVTYAAPVATYAAAPQVYTAPPMGGQPVYTISPERFQLIMQGQPLTPEEIAAMTGQGTAAPIGTVAGGQSFVMPDMFQSPGLTMVGGQEGQFNAAPSSTTIAAATAFEPAAAAPAEPAAPP